MSEAPISFELLACLEGIRAAETGGSAKLRSSLERRQLDALLVRKLVRVDGSQVRTKPRARALLAGVSLGARRARRKALA